MTREHKRKMATPRGVVLCTIIGAMLFTSAYPLRHYLQYRANIKALTAEDSTLDAKIASLQRETETLGTDAEVERLAREKLGMVRPGEQQFAIVAPAPAPPDVKEIAKSSAARRLPRFAPRAIATTAEVTRNIS